MSWGLRLGRSSLEGRSVCLCEAPQAWSSSSLLVMDSWCCRLRNVSMFIPAWWLFSRQWIEAIGSNHTHFCNWSTKNVQSFIHSKIHIILIWLKSTFMWHRQETEVKHSPVLAWSHWNVNSDSKLEANQPTHTIVSTKTVNIETWQICGWRLKKVWECVCVLGHACPCSTKKPLIPHSGSKVRTFGRKWGHLGWSSKCVWGLRRAFSA